MQCSVQYENCETQSAQASPGGPLTTGALQDCVTPTAENGIGGQGLVVLPSAQTGGRQRIVAPVAPPHASPLGHSEVVVHGCHTLVGGHVQGPNAAPLALHVALPVSVFTQEHV